MPSAADLAESKSTSRPTPSCPAFVVTARVKVAGKTGVEMEALTAVSVACLTVYDMVKAVERGMRIEGIRLLEKSGGRSGHYRVHGDKTVALLSVAEALDQVLAHAAPLPAERCRSPRPIGRVLAQDLKALRTQPPADVSAMDGYAVRAGDVATAPVRLKVDRRGRGRPAVHGRRRSGRGGAHLHRRRRARRRRHRRDPGTDHARRRQRRGAKADGQGPQRAPRRASIFAPATVLFAAGHRLTARDLRLPPA